MTGMNRHANETIRLRDLSIGYLSKHHRKVIASHIDASIYSGELTCLLGANGVGKSTLLRTLSAFQPKLAGEVNLLGKDISEYSDKQLSRLIGVVLTEKCEIRNMSVADLIGMGRSPYTGFWGTLGPEDKRKVEEAIHLVHIGDLAGRMVHTLSDGERQKVMIAKALAQETPVIFLDEPTAFLDYPSKVEIMQLLYRLVQTTDKTIFLSTHDLDLALEIADRIWLMDKGTGITSGIPEDLALQGSLARFFEGRGVYFDAHSGLYRIRVNYHAHMHLTGEGFRFRMLRKALRRQGILVDHSEGSPQIQVLPDSFVLQNGDDVRCESIEEVLAEIKNWDFQRATIP